MLHGSFSRVCFPGTSEASVISSANPMPLKQEEEARESFEFRKLDFSRWLWLTVRSIFVALAL